MLKRRAQRDKLDHKKRQQLVEDQIEKHQLHDHNLSISMKVAAVAVGGVVVGALSAGVGLVPYVTLVGLTAAAGGGAVALQYRTPVDSRIILSSESLDDAIEWKKCIEREVLKLETNVMHKLPPSVDSTVISGILKIGLGSGLTGWSMVGYIEDIRVLELKNKGIEGNTGPNTCNHIRKAHIVVNQSAVSVFLAFMEMPSRYWPKDGTCNVYRVVNDHADELILNVAYDSKRIKIILSRFWTLDDDGTYLITYNTFLHDEISDSCGTHEIGSRDKEEKVRSEGFPHINAVITISPSRNHVDFGDDVLITCYIQVTPHEKAIQYSHCVDEIMNDFLSQLIEFREHKAMKIFCYEGYNAREYDSSMTFGSTDVSPQGRTICPRSNNVTAQPNLYRGSRCDSCPGLQKPNHWWLKKDSLFLGDFFFSTVMVVTFCICFVISQVITRA